MPASAAASGSSVRSPRIAAARSKIGRLVPADGRGASRRRARPPAARARGRAARARRVGARPLLRDRVEQRDQVERVARPSRSRARRRTSAPGSAPSRSRASVRGRLLAERAGPDHDAGGIVPAAPPRAPASWPARVGACRRAAGAAALRAGGPDKQASAATARPPSAGRRRRAASACARRSSRPASRGRAASRTTTRLPLLTRSWVPRRTATRSAPAAPASNSARSSGVAAASGASNSCRTIPNANCPSSSPPRAVSTSNSAACGERARLGQQPRLPDPGAALDDNQPTVARLRAHRASPPARPAPPRARAAGRGRSSV